MWSFIIPLIVELLVKFITALIQKWQQKPKEGAALFGAQNQTAFVNKVKWRFWLGPKRLDVARQAFDKAAKRHGSQVVTLSTNPQSYASQLCAGIEKEIEL